MIGAQHTLSWSIASPSEIERTARDLMHLRDRFLSSDVWTATLGRPLILRSWKRCLDLHVDAARRAAPLVLTRDAQLSDLYEANEMLLRAAGPVVNRLADHFERSGYVIVLTDAAGCILQIAGDASVRRRLARIDFVPGGDWSEAAAGTNAIGTALADRRPVQLLAAEHFCDGWTDLTCTAVPIRDPATGTVLGVLDVTGDYRLIRAHLTNLLSLSVLEIEDRLRKLGSSADALPGTSMSSLPDVARDDEDHGYGDATLLTLAGGSVGASLELDVTLRSVAEQTAALLHLESALVCLFADGRAQERATTAWSSFFAAPDSAPLEKLLQGCDVVRSLHERGEPIIVDDISEDALFAAAAETDIRSVAIFPLPTARGIIGFVAASRTTRAHWKLANLRRAFAFMPVAATAVENALLFRSLRQHNRHVEAMNTIAALLGELLDPAESLGRIASAVTEVLACEHGAVFLRSETGAGLVLAGEHAAGDGDAILAAQVDVLGRPLLAGASQRNVYAVPLLEGTKVVGVLHVGRNVHAFDERDMGTVEAIARQLTLALRNARLVRAAGEVEVLRGADRLKSEFLATVSHELRSPLTAIRASVDGLLDQPSNLSVEAASDGFLHTIASQANRLGRLVDQLLDVSQIEGRNLRLDREWHELPGLLADAIDGIAALYGPQRIDCNVPPGAPLLFVDYDRFIQVVYNLLDNACKCSPSPVCVEASWTEDEIVISVADRGPGVRMLERENIFKRFYGSGRKGATRSIGLGLAISRGIVEAHGGSIWVDDRPGGGSVFRFTLPLVAELVRDSGR